MEALPFMIDNRAMTMQEAMQRLLLHYKGCELSIAVNRFSLAGCRLSFGQTFV